MPRLEQVIGAEIGAECFRESEAFAYRDREVVATKLANGAPCASHEGLFAPWPGPQAGVARWFLLDNGLAVGIEEADGTAKRVHLCDATT